MKTELWWKRGWTRVYRGSQSPQIPLRRFPSIIVVGELLSLLLCMLLSKLDSIRFELAMIVSSTADRLASVELLHQELFVQWKCSAEVLGWSGFLRSWHCLLKSRCDVMDHPLVAFTWWAFGGSMAAVNVVWTGPVVPFGGSRHVFCVEAWPRSGLAKPRSAFS